ncbi:MAG: leucine-rich repeat domain-containing protein, partial [Bacteroidota bacterium]
QYCFWNILKLEAGVQYSIIASAKYIYLDKDQKSGSNDINTTGFGNQIEPIVGLHLKLLESFDLGVRYSVTLKQSDYTNLQIVLNLNLNKIFNIERSHTYRNLSKALVKPLEVKKLVLKHTDVSRLNQEIAKFLNLEELDLSNNKLTTLPDDISKLVNLDKLNISDNQLTQLPPAVCQLNNLLNLNAANNQISLIPTEIGNMTKLNHVNFENNKISQLPQSFYSLKKLNYLNLLRNSDKLSIDATISNLSELRELRIDKSAKLPATIGTSNPRLKIVYYNPVNQ